MSGGFDVETLESNVRYYGPRFPATFASARGAILVDESGRRFIDFLSACGSLNYGHNHPRLKRAAIDYLERDGLLNGLDLATSARRAFMESVHRVVLKPRGLDHRIQFTGPTGANAVEAALKLARKATGRTTVAAFSNAFHGVTLGALAVTGGRGVRAASRALLQGVVRLPFEGYQGAGVEALERYERAVADPSGGLEPPAAFIVESVQGEGGLNVASREWLRALRATADRLGALLILDEVQAGCGRTGIFFSFERAGIVPDIVCLAKSLSGLGLPMAINLIRPDRDVWAPGEHNGTFRGNNLAFVTATAALELWEEGLAETAGLRAAEIARWSRDVVARRRGLAPCGLGMMAGLRFEREGAADAVARRAFARGVMAETAGPNDEVLKILPPLTIEPKLLADGLERLEGAIDDVLGQDADGCRAGGVTRRITVDLPSGRLSALVDGEGPAALLLHGNSSCAAVFKAQFPILTINERSVIAPDLPGHGFSDDAEDPGATYSFPGYARAVSGLLDALGIETCDVVGWSLGGHVALELAATDARIRSVLVTGAPPVAPSQAGLEEAFTPSPVMALAGKEVFDATDVDAYLLAMLGDVRLVTEELRAATLRTDGRARSWMMRNALAGQGVDPVAFIASGAKPVGVVQGGRDPFISVDYLKRPIFSALWRGKAQILDSLGHAPHVEAPALFNTLMLMFLAEAGA